MFHDTLNTRTDMSHFVEKVEVGVLVFEMIN